MMYRTFLPLAFLALSCMLPNQASAAFILSTRADGTSPALNAAVGDTFTLNLFLVETGTTSMTSQGLLSFGLRGTYSTSVLEALSVVNNPQFSIVGGGPNPDLSVAGQVGFFGGSLAPPKAASVQLATLQFRVIGEGDALLGFADFDPFFDDFSLGDLTNLDGALFGPAFDQTINFNLQVSAVPEPMSLSLLSLGAVSTISVLRRRKRFHAIANDSPRVI